MLKKHYLYLILSIFIMFTGVMLLSFDNNFKENNNVQISEAAVNIKTEILGVYGAGGKMGANMVFEHLLCSVRFGDNYEHDQEKIQYKISSTATATFTKTTSHTNFPIRAGRRLWVKSVNYIDGLSDGRIIMRGNYRALVEGSHHHYDAGNSGDGYFDCYIYYTTRYTLNKQGGSNGTNYVYYDTYEQHLENNATNGVQISSITIPTRTGYTFKGYYTRQNGGGTQCFDANGNFISSSITRSNANVSVLYANWEANKYNVNFDATNYVPLPYTSSMSFNLCSGSLTTTVDSSNQSVVDFKVSSTQNNWSGVWITLTEKLAVGKVYDWRIDLKSTRSHPMIGVGPEQGGYKSANVSTQWGTISGTFTAVDWNAAFIIYSNDLAVNETLSFRNVVIQESVESVTPADQAIPSMTYTYDSTYSTLPTPTRFGYNFVGWYTAKNGGGTQITTSTKVTTASNHTLYSDWEAKEYSVNLDPNGGSVTQGQIKVRYREKYGTLPTPTRKGYTFKGWWTDPSGGSEITSNTTFTLGAAQTLYAHWEANTYQVTFDDQGGVINFADMIDISYATYSNGIYNYTINGVTLTYNLGTSELTLNGTVQGSFTVLLSKGIELKENDIYQVTYRYISGSPGSTGVGRMVIDACDSNGNNLTARQYLNFIEPLCTSGSRTEALTINSAGAKGNGLKIWFWYNGARTFTNYKIEIKINKTGEQKTRDSNL